MFVTQVEYSELYTFDYDNFKLGAVSDVGEGENPDEVLKELKTYVHDKLRSDHDTYLSMQDRIKKTHYENMMLEIKARALMDEVRFQEKTLQDLGIPECSGLPF